jgi:hypothetical protein
MYIAAEHSFLGFQNLDVLFVGLLEFLGFFSG